LVQSNGKRLFLCGSPRAGNWNSHLLQLMSDIRVANYFL
jgi:hypothetical protein